MTPSFAKSDGVVSCLCDSRVPSGHKNESSYEEVPKRNDAEEVPERNNGLNNFINEASDEEVSERNDAGSHYDTGTLESSDEEGLERNNAVSEASDDTETLESNDEEVPERNDVESKSGYASLVAQMSDLTAAARQLTGLRDLISGLAEQS